MSTEDRYNGWTNRETWALALYINNDQGWQEQVHETLRESMVAESFPSYVATGYGDDIDAAGLAQYRASKAGDIIREHTDDLFDYDSHDGVLPRDLFLAMQDIGSAWRIDWAELGAAFLADIAEDDLHDADCILCAEDDAPTHAYSPRP